MSASLSKFCLALSLSTSSHISLALSASHESFQVFIAFTRVTVWNTRKAVKSLLVGWPAYPRDSLIRACAAPDRETLRQYWPALRDIRRARSGTRLSRCYVPGLPKPPLAGIRTGQ